MPTANAPLPPESPVDRWIGDYRSVGPADWPEGLRETMFAARRGASRRNLLGFAVIVLLVVLAIVLGTLGCVFVPQSYADTFLISLVIGSAILLVPCSLFVVDTARRHEMFGRIVSYPQLERFELSQHIREEVAAAQALGINCSLAGVASVYFVVPAPTVHPPAPSLIIQIDNNPLHHPVEAYIRPLPHTDRHSAEPPLSGSTLVFDFAAPPAPQLAPDSPTQPPLPAELDELRRYISDIQRSHTRFFILYFCLSFALVISILFHLIGFLSFGQNILLSYIVPAFWLLLTGRLFWSILKQRRMLNLLKLDVRDGRAIILEGSVAIRQLRDEGLLDPRERIVNPGIVRHLPYSQHWWDIDGIPAPWRR